jgi:hypothetical protein
MHSRTPYPRFLLVAALALLAAAAQASVGLTEIVGKDGDGPVTIYYPSSSESQPVKRGPFTLQASPFAATVALVISHGSAAHRNMRI